MKAKEFYLTDYKTINPSLDILGTLEFLFELPMEFGGTLESSSVPIKDSLMAFDIKTGAEEAQKAFDQREKPADAYGDP